MTVIGFGHFHVFESTLGVFDLCVFLIVKVIMRVLQNEFFAAKRSFSVILLQNVEFAEFHPGFSVVHKLADVLVKLSNRSSIFALSTQNGHFSLASLTVGVV